MNEPRPGGRFGRTRPFSWSNLLLNALSLSLLLSCHSPLLLLLYFIHTMIGHLQTVYRVPGSPYFHFMFIMDMQKRLGFVWLESFRPNFHRILWYVVHGRFRQPLPHEPRHKDSCNDDDWNPVSKQTTDASSSAPVVVFLFFVFFFVFCFFF